jgi:lysophospholipase L1-like esterase
VSTIIWFEGINDLNRNANTPVETITAAMAEGVRRMRAGIPGVRVIGGTVLSALGSTNGAHGSPAQDVERRRLNTFIRTSGLFDAVIDFDAATIDEATGRLRAEFVPDSTTGGPGDSLHPNRAGYLAMAGSIDLGILAIGK